MKPAIPSLHTIAARANKEHRLAIKAVGNAIAHGMRCGELLLEAKARVGHGNFLRWQKDYFDGSERMAQNYMRLASNPQRVADLGTDSIRVAIEALTNHSQPKPVPLREKMSFEQAGAYLRANPLPAPGQSVPTEEDIQAWMAAAHREWSADNLWFACLHACFATITRDQFVAAVDTLWDKARAEAERQNAADTGLPPSGLGN